MKSDPNQLILMYSLSKKIHRWVMWLATVIGGVMIITGLELEDISEGEVGILSSIIGPDLVRSIHRSLAGWFVWVLIVMMTSGLFMWLFPKLMKLRRSLIRNY